MICRRIALNFSLLNRRLVFSAINLNNEWSKTLSKRCVHSTNIYEIDYLVSRYRLTNRSYGQNNSSLAYFNTIDDFSYKTERDMRSDSIKSMLNISKSDAKKLVRNYPILTERSDETLEKQLSCLSSKYDLKYDQFLSCPWILYLPITFITERLNVFQNSRITNDYLVLLLFPLPSFRRLSKRIISKKDQNVNIFEDFNKRLIYFTENLNLTHEEFCDLIHDNMFLFKYDFERLENIMNELLSAGIKPDLIVSDITVFTNNIQIMKERIAECRRIQMPIKTWMLRSTKHDFEVSAKRHVENKRVLKDNKNGIEYLATQLKCEKQLIHFMMKRYPRIVSISGKKLSEVISFLFGTGFSTYHIFDTPKILFHKVDKIKKRMKELQKINVKPNALKVLTLSDTEYNKLLKQLKASIPIPENIESERLKSHVSN